MTAARADQSGRRASCARAHLLVVGLLAPMALQARAAAADRYEATVWVRPIGGVGRFTDAGATVSSYGGGGELGLSYGVQNWLDLGGELAAAVFQRATYNGAMVTIMGIPTSGRVTRTSRLAQLRAGATLRLGLVWVATVYLGAGLSARIPTAGTLRMDDQGDTLNVTPDGMAAAVQLDACVVARVGFEHRLDRRWSVGVAVDASRSLGLGASPVNLVSGGISLAYTWYPQW